MDEVVAVTLLSVKGLSKHFEGLKAVDDVTFDLPKGQIRALIGPNGAGKTTFVSMICGRLSASTGAILFDGVDVTKMPAHKRIALGMAYTFQITSIFPALSVTENVALAARRVTPDQKAVAVAVHDALAKVGLDGRAQDDAGDLSYGHQRLLEIAMGIVQSPKLLILDEPTQGLADSEIKNFIKLVRSLTETTTILLIEHNMNVVMEVSDFVTVFNLGAVLFEGAPEAVRGNKEVQAAYLGNT